LKDFKNTFVLQHDRSDCGVACLASIIQYHGGEANIETLRKASGTSLRGTTLLGLMQGAQQHGMNAAGMEAECIENLRELKEPAILHVVVEEKLEHYVVYYPMKAGNLKSPTHHIIGDPARGILEIDEYKLNKIWRRRALLTLSPTEKFKQKKIFNGEKRKWIISLINDDLPLLTVSLAIGVCIAVLGISTAIFSQKLIDDILPKGNSSKLILSLVFVTLLLAARGGLGFLRGFFVIRQGVNFNNRLTANFYANVLRLPKSFFDTRKTGEILTRMGDTKRIQTVVTALAGAVIIDFLFVLVCFAFVFRYSFYTGVITIMCVPAYAFVLLKFSKPIHAAQKNVMSSYALVESNFIDTIQGVAEIKLTGKEDFFEKQNASVFGRFLQNVANLGRLNLRFVLTSELIGVFFTMTMLGVAAWLVLDKQLKLGEMVALLSFIGGIIPSVNRLVGANVQIQEAKVAFDRMFEFASMEKEHDLSTDDRFSITEIKVADLSFRFPGRKAILKNISLEVKRGEILALVGESGEGKSTLIQLLQKFYVPETGRILIDGIDLELLRTRTWREQIAAVPAKKKGFLSISLNFHRHTCLY
jgi:ABC-type bacteriocin/lantibiotic exporter with double-glycine peptidase domain